MTRAALVSAFISSVMITAGCVYVPEHSPVYRSSEVGNSEQVPLKIGVADRDAVIARWGKPSYRSEHDLGFGYLFATKLGTATGLLIGPCIPYIGTIDTYGSDDVWLEFDKRGVLKRCEKHLIGRSWWSGYERDDVAWKRFAESIPDKPLGLIDEGEWRK